MNPFGELKIVASNSLAPGDHFGRTAIISDTILIVGADDDDDNGSGSGSVFIFEKDSGGENNWGQFKQITPSDASASDGFGVGLALDGDTLIVGAHDDDVTGASSGSVYVFERNLGGTNNWGQRKKIVPPDGAANDRFGWAVDVSGDTLIVGAFWDDTNCSSCDNGSAYVFERDEGGADNWGFVKKLVPGDLQSDDQMGRAVLISGSTAFVSAGSYDVLSYERLGRIYVFDRDEGGSNNWGQSDLITASDGFLDNNFAFSMELFEDLLVVGTRNDDEAASDAGAVYLFERDAGGADNWGEIAKLLAPDAQSGDRLGQYVAVHGDSLVATANMEDDAATDGGAAYVFSRQSEGLNEWTFENKLFGSSIESDDRFGVWTSIWNDYLVVGSHRGDFAGSESGEVYLFQRGFQPPSMDGIFVPIINNCKLLYFDNFSNPNSGWPVAQAGSNLYEYRSGEYRVLVGDTFSLAGAIPGVAFSDYLVTTEVRNIANRAGSYGLLFGQVPGFTGLYTFEIDNAKNWEIWKWNNGWSLLASGTSAALNSGTAKNSIAIERNGSSIKAFANGTLVTSLNDGTFTGLLNVGVWATSFDEPNLDVRYDNYKVEPIGCGISTAAPLGSWSFDDPAPDELGRPEVLDIKLPERER